MIAWFKKRKEEEPTLRKEEEPTPRKVFVPEVWIEDVLLAWDQYTSAPSNEDALLRWRFWQMAATACSELREGNWAPEMKDGRVPYFLEVLDQ